MTGQVATAPAAGYTGQIDPVTGRAVVAGSSLNPTTAFPPTMAALIAALTKTLPGFAAQFTVAPASSYI